MYTVIQHEEFLSSSHNPHTFIWLYVFLSITKILVQLYSFKYFYMIILIYLHSDQVFLSIKNNLQKYMLSSILSNTNILHKVIYHQVILSNTDNFHNHIFSSIFIQHKQPPHNYMVSCILYNTSNFQIDLSNA